MPLYKVTFNHSLHKDPEYVLLYDKPNAHANVKKRVQSFYAAMSPTNIKVRIVKK